MCCIAGCELTRVRWHIFSVELGRQSFSPWVGSGWGEEPWLRCMKCHHGDVSYKVVFQCLLRRSVDLDLQITHRFSKNNGSVLEKLRQINFYYQFPSYYESALYWFRHWYFFSLSPCIPSLASYRKGSPDLQNVLAYEELEHVDRNSREPLAHLLWSRGTAEFTVLGIIVARGDEKSHFPCRHVK